MGLSDMNLLAKRKGQVVVENENKKQKMEEKDCLQENDAIKNKDVESDRNVEPIVENKPLLVLPSWCEVESLPPGWKLREIKAGGKSLQYIMSPQAKIFPCRKLALKHLLEAGGSEEEVEGMRGALFYEGWHQSEYLPEGWRFKQGSGEQAEFLTEKCQVLKGLAQATIHLKTQKKVQIQLRNLKYLYQVKLLHYQKPKNPYGKQKIKCLMAGWLTIRANENSLKDHRPEYLRAKGWLSSL